MVTPQRFHIRVIPLILCFLLALACGQVNAPIPPEDVGIEAKVRKQQKQEEQDKLTDDQVPIEEETVELPALRPIGTR